MTKLTHTSRSIAGQLELYDERAKSLDLIWCKQVLNLMQADNCIDHTQKLKINDIGCNYFQFYKEIKKNKLENAFDYFGYDIDQDFIDIGLKYFPNLHNKYDVLNIEEILPRATEVSIISATLEHAENPYKLLANVLSTTSKKIILRTFIGNHEIIKLLDDPKFVQTPYYVNQFSLFKVANIFLENGFAPKLIQDIATNKSHEYELLAGSDIFRQMYILVGEKLANV